MKNFIEYLKDLDALFDVGAVSDAGVRCERTRERRPCGLLLIRALTYFANPVAAQIFPASDFRKT